MSFKTILCLVDGGAPSNVALKAAIQLAKRFGAQLDLLAVAGVPAPLFVADAASLELQGAALDAARERAQTALKDAAAACDAAQLTYETALAAAAYASIEEAVAERGLYADLIVGGKGSADAQTARRILDGALFNSPAPLLLWPETRDPALAATVGAAPAIAWDGRQEASRAARAAMPLIEKAAKAAILTANIQDWRWDNEAEPGEPFQGWLARRGLTAELRRLEGSPVAKLLLEDAAAWGADLIVMGAYGHSRLREAIFGGVTEAMLENAPLPLLLDH